MNTRCYVAMGDSFTAGAGSEPGERWADLLAGELRRLSDDMEYRNLAVNGATSSEVTEQIRPALELEPDLVSVICGGNDVLLSVRPDIGAFAENMHTILSQLRTTLPSLILVTATYPASWRFMDMRPRTRDRVERGFALLNDEIRAIAVEHRAVCLDVDGHPGLDSPENFSQDGLHPSPLGHARAASEFSEVLL